MTTTNNDEKERLGIVRDIRNIYNKYPRATQEQRTDYCVQILVAHDALIERRAFEKVAADKEFWAKYVGSISPIDLIKLAKQYAELEKEG